MELRKGIIVELRLKSSRSFQLPSKTLGGFYFVCFRFMVLLLCIVILAWTYHSLDSFATNQQSTQQGLEYCRAFDKVFSLHHSIMPTTGESEEVNEEEIILELKR